MAAPTNTILDQLARALSPIATAAWLSDVGQGRLDVPTWSAFVLQNVAPTTLSLAGHAVTIAPPAPPPLPPIPAAVLARTSAEGLAVNNLYRGL